MKKIALTVSNPSLDTQVEPRLARSAFILLVEPETMTWVSLPNPGAKANSSAEVRIVQALSEWEVSDIVSGNFGATASEALRAAGITMHRFGFGTSAREAVGILRAGKFPTVQRDLERSCTPGNALLQNEPCRAPINPALLRP